MVLSIQREGDGAHDGTKAGWRSQDAAKVKGQYKEDAHTTILVNRSERNPKIHKEAIAIHGTTCAGCGFSFGVVYGSRGADYIEVHHLKAISTYGGTVVVNPATDMAVVCANCHRMIHRRINDPLSINQLRERLAQAKRRTKCRSHCGTELLSET